MNIDHIAIGACGKILRDTVEKFQFWILFSASHSPRILAQEYCLHGAC